MRIKNTKIKLRLSGVSLSNVLSFNNFLHWTEFILWGLTTAFVILATTEQRALSNWITFVFVILVVRVVRFLFYGNKAFPTVEFDLGLLVAITSLLIITIIQGNDKGYSTLGGVSVVGIGVIILSALTFYLLASAYKSYNLRWLWHILHSIITAKFLYVIFWGDINPLNNRVFVSLDLAVLAMIFLPLSLLGMQYFKNPAVKILSLISLLASGYLTLVALEWGAVLLGALGVLFYGVFGLVTNRGSEFQYLNIFAQGTGKVVERIVRSYAVWATLLGIIGLGVVAGGYVSDADFKASMQNLWDSYVEIDQYFPETKDWASGYGLVAYTTQLGAALIAYGILGLLVFVLYYSQVLLLAAREVRLVVSRNYDTQSAWILTIFNALFLVVSVTLIAGSNLLLSFVTIVLAAKIFAFNSPQTSMIANTMHMDFSSVAKNAAFTRVMPGKYWLQILRNLRLVLVIAIIVFTPMMINFLKDLF